MREADQDIKRGQLMLEIERLTNAGAVVREIKNPTDDLICDVGYFRLFDKGTGKATDLYLVLNSANDKEKEVTIESSDEDGVETLISSSSSFRKSAINYEDYEKTTNRFFGDALHVDPAVIAKYKASITTYNLSSSE